MRPVIARFAERSWRNQPTKNWQSCDLIYGDMPATERQTPLASVYRKRKTKRSAWLIEMRPMASVPGMTPQELRDYFAALATAAETVDWPKEDINP